MSGGLSLRSGPRGSITDVEGGGFAVSERIEQSPLALVRRLVRYIRDDSTVRVRCVEQFGRAPSLGDIAAIRERENRAREALAARVEALPEKDCDALAFRPAPSGWVLREERRREAEQARRALEAARQSLRADIRERERLAGFGAGGDQAAVCADELIRMAAARHLMTYDDVVGRGRTRAVVRVRALVCALLRLRGNSLPAIGRMLDNRDHSSVSYLLDRWREGWCDLPPLAETFDELAVLVRPVAAAESDDDHQQEAA